MDGRWDDVFIYFNLKLVYNVPCSTTDLCLYFVRRKLKFYGGNYDAFMKTRLELMEAQGKQYQWEQDQIAHMKVGIFFYRASLFFAHIADQGLWITINFIRSQHSLQWFKNTSFLFAERAGKRETAFSGDNDTTVILGVQCTTWIRNSDSATVVGIDRFGGGGKIGYRY
jgi:hypothetical protein